ncbi:hypothetical protein AAMO2058_000143600 [Amorphochlora amoebiformis]|mmetsp:Transcript_6500/g.10005  ORF Transcript_6500/g.10005 Transcript_6500/m.10005 type:complete len:361 (-) Transcript_6500:464-1546(-)|eukprot:1342590-Amorphochlora_amoeboformis.AAC.2
MRKRDGLNDRKLEDCKPYRDQTRESTPEERKQGSKRCRSANVTAAEPAKKQSTTATAKDRPSIRLIRKLTDTIWGNAYYGVNADNKPCCVKVSDIRQSIRTMENPIEEIKILQDLRNGPEHPGKKHICHLLASFEYYDKQPKENCDTDDEQEQPSGLWTVLEWSNGGEALNSVTMMNQNTTRILFKQIVSAVHYLHRCGIAHLDLSLENILLHWPSGRPGIGRPMVKIIDFGMAVKLDSKTDLRWRGKRQYMAPEIFAGAQDAEPRKADIYSLGIILFIFATRGIPPYECIGDQNFEFLWRSGSKGIEEIFRQWGFTNMPPSLVDLISKLFCPLDKRASMEELLSHAYMLGVDGGGQKNR